jgi:periplasmic protein TonB
METLAQNKTLPDISDLKGKNLSSTVILRIIIGKDGAVRCVDPVQGDADLFPRSVEAARQWRFRPYLLNGQPIMVQTRIEFVFKKGKVRDLQAER